MAYVAPTEARYAARAAAREKFLAKIIKEGGKKGVEIEGASDMGGLVCHTGLEPQASRQGPRQVCYSRV